MRACQNMAQMGHVYRHSFGVKARLDERDLVGRRPRRPPAGVVIAQETTRRCPGLRTRTALAIEARTNAAGPIVPKLTRLLLIRNSRSHQFRPLTAPFVSNPC
jgi:hypothetical protein